MLKFLCKLVDLTESYVRKQRGCFFLNTVYIMPVCLVIVKVTRQGAARAASVYFAAARYEGRHRLAN